MLVLADATDYVNKFALAGCQTLCEVVDQRDTVPVGIGLPVVAVLAVVVRGHRKISDLLLDLDLADAADDPKFCDVLHGSSFRLGLQGDFLTVFKGPRRSRDPARSEEQTYELQSLMRISYAVSCLKKK